MLTKQLKKLSEDILQSKIYKWYYNTYCTKLVDKQHLIFAVPNGGKRTMAEAMKLKATGLVSGVSDLIIVQPNRCIFVELKTPTGKQSDSQKDFQNKVTALGFEYWIVRSLEQFKELVQCAFT